MPEPLAYSRKQVVLHWLIAALVAFQYLMHNGIEAAWTSRMDGTIPNEPFPNPHTIAGIVILILTIWRVTLRLRHGAPALPEKEPQALKRVATVTHIAFYTLLIGMPLSGALAWVAGLELPANAHGIAAKIMLGLIGLHVVAAFVQKFWLKTDVMARMSPKLMRAQKGPISNA